MLVLLAANLPGLFFCWLLFCFVFVSWGAHSGVAEHLHDTNAKPRTHFFKSSEELVSIHVAASDCHLRHKGPKNLSCATVARVDIWAGDATKQFPVEKRVFPMRRGDIQWMRGLIRISTGKSNQWRGLGHSMNRQTLKTEKPHPPTSSPTTKMARFKKGRFHPD